MLTFRHPLHRLFEEVVQTPVIKLFDARYQRNWPVMPRFGGAWSLFQQGDQGFPPGTAHTTVQLAAEETSQLTDQGGGKSPENFHGE
eukprot:12937209-Alexandrium_andersonii.AAC.1